MLSTDNIGNLFKVSKKVFVFTGGSGLIGRKVIEFLIKNEAVVISVDLLKSNIKHPNFFEIQCDITNKELLNHSIKKNVLKYLNGRKVDVLVNMASLVVQLGDKVDKSIYPSFQDQTQDEWMSFYKVDICGSLNMVQCMLPIFNPNNASIINVSSTYGLVSPKPSIYDCFKTETNDIEKPIGYSASKSALLNVTRHLAVHLASKNIRVNVLLPGGVNNDPNSEFLKSYSAHTALNRMASPSEYIGPIVFLSSKASSYMTGASLIVDGGWTAL